MNKIKLQINNFVFIFKVKQKLEKKSKKLKKVSKAHLMIPQSCFLVMISGVNIVFLKLKTTFASVKTFKDFFFRTLFNFARGLK